MKAQSLFSVTDIGGTSVDALEQHVHSRLSGRIAELRILVSEGELVLRGRVSTYYAKQLVQHAVMVASRAPIRANEIEVR